VRFLNDGINYRTYQRLGDRRDRNKAWHDNGIPDPLEDPLQGGVPGVVADY